MSIMRKCSSQADVAAIKAKTDNLPASPANETTGAAIKAKTDNLPASPANETTGAAIKAQTDKLAGATPASDSVIGNWQSGTATSGETGADLVTIGANDIKNKLHSLLVSIHNLTAAATITVKMFQQVNGVERKVYSQPYVKGTDPDGLWVVDASVGIHEALRVEVQSNQETDNGLAIDYDYFLEVM